MKKENNDTGALCISLDFEKFWGLHDLNLTSSKIDQFKNVSEIAKRLLTLFEKYDTHVTWAVVGLLNYNSIEELIEASNEINLLYDNPDFNPFPINKHQLEKYDEACFLASDIIDLILKSKNQELASHTYSHYYTLEKGQNKTDFELDLAFFNNTINTKPSSIVFPRNQVNSIYLESCRQFGFSAYRGNQDNKFWNNTAYKKEKLINKIARTLDAYIKLSKDNFIEWKWLKGQNGDLLNIPASRFLKPVKHSKVVENLKIRRIKKQMLRAAKKRSIYHLWWHPHNFLTKTEENFKQLESILKFRKKLERKFKFTSLNMEGISGKIN